MKFLWPETKAESTVLVRIGRVIHWGGAAVCIIGLLAFIYGVTLGNADKFPDLAARLLLGSLAAGLFGRGVRYVLCNE